MILGDGPLILRWFYHIDPKDEMGIEMGRCVLADDGRGLHQIEEGLRSVAEVQRNTIGASQCVAPHHKTLDI
jgi:hypothetical protein